MNNLAAFAQRTDIVSKFRRALLIFWLPLIAAAVAPVLMILISDAIEGAVYLRWPLLMLLTFSLLIAIPWAVSEFRVRHLGWEQASDDRTVYTTYFVIVCICIAIFAFSAIVAPRQRPEARAPDPPYKSANPDVDLNTRPDLDCKNCGGVDVDRMQLPPGSVPLPRPRPEPSRQRK